MLYHGAISCSLICFIPEVLMRELEQQDPEGS